jgi:hypothetical protein
LALAHRLCDVLGRLDAPQLHEPRARRLGRVADELGGLALTLGADDRRIALLRRWWCVCVWGAVGGGGERV